MGEQTEETEKLNAVLRLRVSGEELEALDELAGRLERSRSWLLRRALQNLLAEHAASIAAATRRGRG